MADFVKVIKAFETLKKEKLIDDYVIGGGVACTFYSEGTTTEDLDIYVEAVSKEKIIDKNYYQ